MNVLETFKMDKKIVVITGGAGLLGQKHAEAVIEAGGVAVLSDISETALGHAVDDFKARYGENTCEGYIADITDKGSIESMKDALLKKYGHIDVLINNAANNPKMEGSAANMGAVQFEDFPVKMWMDDLAVGLTGAFLCAQVLGKVMASQGKGVILNISSDLGIIAPDQRIYRKEGLPEAEQTIKPVTYSVIKHGLLGLTKYLATYYAEKGVRCNAVCPAGVWNGQDEAFVKKLTNLVPMGRMADQDEYKSTVLYLISDASSYMTGSVVVVDGGRTCW